MCFSRVKREEQSQQGKLEEVCIVPGMKFCTSLARYIDGSAESRGLIISVVTHGEFRWIWICSTHTEATLRCIWPREQISPDQNITPFPLLVSFPLTAVLTDVAPTSEKLAIEEREKASVMAMDWQ